MQCCAADGWAQIPGNPRDRRKSARGNSALLSEQSNKAGIRLVRGKPSDGAARDAAAQLNGSKDLFHARDRRARKCFSVELHFEGAVLRIADLDGRGVLARTAKEKFTKPIGFTGIVVSGAPENKSAGAVAE